MGYYLGDMLLWDVYNYTNMKQQYGEVFGDENIQERKLLAKLKKHESGKLVFHLPAMVFGALWFVYRGMYKSAIIFDVVMLFFTWYFSINSLTVAIIVNAIGFVLVGFMALPIYYDHIHIKIDKRGLIKRPPVLVEELDVSLRKEGMPSIKAVLIYILLRYVFVLICEDIIYTLTAIF